MLDVRLNPAASLNEASVWMSVWLEKRDFCSGGWGRGLTEDLPTSSLGRPIAFLFLFSFFLPGVPLFGSTPFCLETSDWPRRERALDVRKTSTSVQFMTGTKLTRNSALYNFVHWDYGISTMSA